MERKQIFPDTDPRHMLGDPNSMAGINLPEAKSAILHAVAQLRTGKNHYTQVQQITDILLILRPPGRIDFVVRYKTKED